MAGKLDDIPISAVGASTPRRGAAGGRPRKDSAPRTAKATPPYRENVIRRGLMKFYGLLAVGLMPLDPEMAMVVAANSEKMAESWEMLARTNPSVRRMLYRLIKTSGWTAVMIGHAPLFIVAGKRFGPERIRGVLELIVSNNPGLLQVPDFDPEDFPVAEDADA